MESKKKYWHHYLIILFGCVLFWLPFAAGGFTDGAEFPFHYARIMTLSDSIKAGIFPVKIMPTHMKGFGYGIGFFYPNLFIYPPAIAIALGMGYEIAIKIYLFVMTFVCGVIAYKCFEKITGSARIALVGEILLVGSRLNDSNIFGGGGIPHLFSYLILPLAFCGLLEALSDKKKGYVKYAVGMTLVLLSHNMIFLTMMFAMLIIVLVHGKVIIKKPVILGKLFGISVLAMGVTTAYWLPAIEQIQKVAFKCFYGNAYSVADHILTFRQLVFENVGVHYFVLFVISAGVYVWLLLKNRSMPLDITSVFVVTVLLLWLMCSRFIWLSPVGEALNFFEYTSRFEFVLVALMVLFVVLVQREAFAEFGSRQNAVLKIGDGSFWYEAGFLFACVVLILTTRLAVRQDFLARDNRQQFTRQMMEEHHLISFGEWLPVECEPSECNETNIARTDGGSTAEGVKSEDCKSFDVWLPFDREYYDMPYVYYYGYRAYLLDDNGNPSRELETGEAFDDNGYVRVFIPEDLEGVGHVLVTYRKTTLQKISYVVTIAFALGICVYLLVNNKRKS
ncbi:MAG: hypothetical protein E7305_11265 [Butyrivibrio sp.]|nr:hypothetical protein [Butyrivibrio sp.]